MLDEAQAIAELRAFTRFYTVLADVLDEGLLQSVFSLAECRVLYELAHREGPTAADLARDLGLDPAYLSRILRKLKGARLLVTGPSASDGRQRILALTEAGCAAFGELDAASQRQARDLLAPLTVGERAALIRALGTVRSILDRSCADAAPFIIRDTRLGDIGWIIHRHGVIYHEEFGWDESFEALVAEIAGRFLAGHDPRREHCWVAERHGEVVGSVFLVDAGDGVAKLRLLYVEATARGLGVGRALVHQCLSFARQCGYRRMTLWTNDVLTAARRIYETEGFELVERAPHHSFGQDLVGETWQRDL